MKTILIVDDRADNRALLVAILAHRKYRLLEAKSGEEALKVAHKEKPDLVIADVLMPSMDGFEFVRQLRNDLTIAETPVIFNTASYIEEEARKLAEDCGVDHIIIKPAEPEDVLKIVDLALGQDPKLGARKVAPQFESQHLHLITNKVAQKVEELEKLNEQLEREIADRKNAQETLTQLLHQHELIIKSAGEGIHGVDLHGNIIFENPKGADLLGWQVDELLGKPAHATIHHKRPDGTKYPIEDCPIHGSMRDGVTRRVTNDVFWRKDGTSFRVDYVVAPIKDNYGRISGSIVTFKDITEQYAADARLKLQEQQYRLLFETNPNPMWVFDTVALQILAVNQAAIAQYGYSQEEFLKLSLMDLRTPDDVQNFKKTKGSLSPHDVSHFSGQFRHAKKDGSPMLVEIYSGPIVWMGVSARIATAIDVTERIHTGERMHAILQSALDCIISMDHEGRIIEFNPAAEKTFDYRREDAMGRLLTELIIPPALRESHRRGLSHYLATGEASVLSKRIELPAMRCDGSEFPVELAITRIGTLQPPIFTAFIRDITERKRVEEELQSAHDRLEHLLAHTPAVIYSLRVEGEKVTPVFVSESMEPLLGVTAKESMSHEWWLESLHPEDRDRALGVLTEALKADGYSMEYRIRHKDGSYHWVEDNNRLVRDDAGRPQQMVGVWTDITGRKQSEQRLLDQAEIIERAQDAIIMRDFFTDIVTVWNSGAERIYGWTVAEAIGRPMGELIFRETKERDALLEQLLLNGKYHGEFKHRAKDGREVIVDARVTLIRNEDGTPRSVIGINTNITEQKKLETQLLRAQRLESIGTLASGVAHDLNNILVPILMAAPILREEESADEREKFLTVIESSAQRGADIVKQVLTFARGAGGDRVLLQPIYLLEEIAKIAQETFPKTVRMRTSYPEDLRLIEADATQLHQVLLNLCVNARDAMPEGGTLSLTAENFDVDEQYATMTPGIKAGPHILVSVTDTGTGIPEHIVEKIFDPFFTTKELGQGSGLGLSTALGIIRSHGGSINVYSTRKGTTFRVLLPAAIGASEPSESKTHVDVPAGHGETILIVDDESPIRAVATAVLAKNGYTVLSADDGPAALAIFMKESKAIDVVLTDLSMPIMNGLVLARTLQKIDAKTKVIVSSARDSDYNLSELKDIGVQESLTKPYTRETLLRTIDRVLHEGE